MKVYVFDNARNWFEPPLARVSSVLVWLGKTERPESSVFLPARKLGCRPFFRSGKTWKIPFLGLSLLLLNPKETLVIQGKPPYRTI